MTLDWEKRDALFDEGERLLAKLNVREAGRERKRVAAAHVHVSTEDDGKTWRDIGDGWQELRAPTGATSPRRIRGIATSKAVTSNNQSSLPDGMDAILPLPLRADHEAGGRGIGKVVLLRRNADLVYFEAALDDNPAARFAWSKMTTGYFRSVSISHARGSRLLAKVAGVRFFDAWTLAEISVVKSGANPDARFEILQGDGSDWRDYVATTKPAEPQIPYAGTWKQDAQYRAGEFTTRRGALWAALADSKGVTPGTAPDVWRLAVKSGEADRLESQRRTG